MSDHENDPQKQTPLMAEAGRLIEAAFAGQDVGDIEVREQMRSLARTNQAAFLAHLEAGFTEVQAFTIITTITTALFTNRPQG